MAATDHDHIKHPGIPHHYPGFISGTVYCTEIQEETA
jgi:hypothetical protein